MSHVVDAPSQDSVGSCWALERQRLLEDKQGLLYENIHLRKELLQLQQDHIALLQLISVQQQQLERREAGSSECQHPAQTPPRHPFQPPGAARTLQQQYMVRTTSSVRNSFCRESNALPMQLSRSSTPQSSRKPKIHSTLQRSIQSLLKPRKSWSRTLSINSSVDPLSGTDGNSSSSHHALSSSRAVIDVAALTGLSNSAWQDSMAIQQQQQLPRMDGVSSSTQYCNHNNNNNNNNRSSSPTASSEASTGTFSRSHPDTFKRWRMQPAPKSSNCSSTTYRSSSPGLIVGSSAAAANSSSSKQAGGWRLNRPSPLTAIHTAPAAAHGLPPHPGNSSRCMQSSCKYPQQQQQQQLCTVGSEASEVYEVLSCPANVQCLDFPWNETPTATRYNSSSIDSNAPLSASSSSSRGTGIEDNISTSSMTLAVVPAAASSNSVTASSIAGSDCRCDAAAAAAGGGGGGRGGKGGGGILLREDTASLLSKDADVDSAAACAAAANDITSSNRATLASRSASERHRTHSNTRYAGCGHAAALKASQGDTCYGGDASYSGCDECQHGGELAAGLDTTSFKI